MPSSPWGRIITVFSKREYKFDLYGIGRCPGHGADPIEFSPPNASLTDNSSFLFVHSIDRHNQRHDNGN